MDGRWTVGGREVDGKWTEEKMMVTEAGRDGNGSWTGRSNANELQSFTITGSVRTLAVISGKIRIRQSSILSRYCYRPITIPLPSCYRPITILLPSHYHPITFLLPSH
jgi:hypothetical protein